MPADIYKTRRRIFLSGCAVFHLGGLKEKETINKEKFVIYSHPSWTGIGKIVSGGRIRIWSNGGHWEKHCGGISIRKLFRWRSGF
jgi:hypothetical protein